MLELGNAAEVQFFLQVESLELLIWWEDDGMLVVDDHPSVCPDAVHLDGVPFAERQRFLRDENSLLVAERVTELRNSADEGKRDVVAAASSLSVIQNQAVRAFGTESDFKVKLRVRLVELCELHVTPRGLREERNRAGHHQSCWNLHQFSVVARRADVSASIAGLDVDEFENFSRRVQVRWERSVLSRPRVSRRLSLRTASEQNCRSDFSVFNLRRDLLSRLLFNVQLVFAHVNLSVGGVAHAVVPSGVDLLGVGDHQTVSVLLRFGKHFEFSIMSVVEMEIFI